MCYPNHGIANKKYALDWVISWIECNDFPESFFKLCEEVMSHMKLYIVGDIFQSIFEEHVISDYSADYFLTNVIEQIQEELYVCMPLGLDYFWKVKAKVAFRKGRLKPGYIYTEDNDKHHYHVNQSGDFLMCEDDKSVEIKL